MALNRRDFLLSAAAAAVGPTRSAWPAEQSTPGQMPDAVRQAFPIAASETFFNGAAHHPLSPNAARGLERYVQFRVLGEGPGRHDFAGALQQDLKAKYASLINAQPSEIAFVQSTSDGESVVAAGLGLPREGGNVVLDELHFISALYMYGAFAKQGLDVRIVKHRDWAIDVRDIEKAIDRNTRLVSMALVSNVNGFMHDARAVADIAHAHGAYLYADVIQAVGAVPLDVKALGIDFAAASTYKWLMAERGFGFLYVREDLQDRLASTRWGHRHLSRFDRLSLTWERQDTAARYESGTVSACLALCANESLDYIQELGGVARIRAHARRLTDRLQRELPPRGFVPITPRGTDAPIVAYEVKDPAALDRRLRDAKIAATITENERRLRLSVSVFNNDQDIDRLLTVLAG